MAATREDVDRWIETAKEKNYKYIISVCDTFDWDDYPVYVTKKSDLMNEYKLHQGINMQRVNEIICINDDGTATENLNLSDIN